MLKVLVFALTIFASSAWANTAIRIVVPFAPGSATDLMARTISDPLSQNLGVPVLVENRMGAGGNIANRAVAAADPNTVVLLVNGVGIASNAALEDADYNFINGLVPMAKLGSLPVVFVTSKKSKIHNLQDLLVKDSVTYGSSGGGISYLYGQLIAHDTKKNFIHVGYKGAHQSLPDLTSGQLDSAFIFLSNVMSYIQADKITPVAVGNEIRLPDLPSVPTMKELGLESTNHVDSWFAVFSNDSMQTQQRERIQAALLQVLAEPEIKQRLHVLGIQTPKSHSLSRQFLLDEYHRYQTLVDRTQAKRFGE